MKTPGKDGLRALKCLLISSFFIASFLAKPLLARRKNLMVSWTYFFHCYVVWFKDPQLCGTSRILKMGFTTKWLTWWAITKQFWGTEASHKILEGSHVSILLPCRRIFVKEYSLHAQRWCFLKYLLLHWGRENPGLTFLWRWDALSKKKGSIFRRHHIRDYCINY